MYYNHHADMWCYLHVLQIIQSSRLRNLKYCKQKKYTVLPHSIRSNLKLWRSHPSSPTYTSCHPSSPLPIPIILCHPLIFSVTSHHPFQPPSSYVTHLYFLSPLITLANPYHSLSPLILFAISHHHCQPSTFYLTHLYFWSSPVTPARGDLKRKLLRIFLTKMIFNQHGILISKLSPTYTSFHLSTPMPTPLILCHSCPPLFTHHQPTVPPHQIPIPLNHNLE